MLKDQLDDWGNDADVEIPSGLPQPFLWRLLVMPVKPREVSAGGIVIAKAAQEAEQYLTYIGKVLAVGDLAFSSERFQGQSGFPKVGDWIGYGKHAGQPMLFKGLRLVVMNDDHVLFTCPDPSGFRIYL